MKIKIAIPKGHLESKTLKLLEDAGIGVGSRDERQLFIRTNDPDIELVLVRAEDIPDIVGQGATDLGITGIDLVMENNREKDIVELFDLGYGGANLVVAAPKSSGIKSVKDIKPGTRVATEFPNATKKFFKKKGINVEVVRVTGATEITPLIGVADIIVDVTSTGTTLRTHGLQIIDTIVESTSRLIANPESLKKAKSKIEDVKVAMESVIRASDKKLVMMNVPEAKLDAVKNIMPGMSGPTVSKVEAKGLLAIQVVVEASCVYELVCKVKKEGARDILVMPIERILP